VWVCVLLKMVMFVFSNVRVGVCVSFVMFGCVYVWFCNVLVYMCVFCNVWLWVSVALVISGCLYTCGYMYICMYGVCNVCLYA
jgi:hypothetical protein